MRFYQESSSCPCCAVGPSLMLPPELPSPTALMEAAPFTVGLLTGFLLESTDSAALQTLHQFACQLAFCIAPSPVNVEASRGYSLVCLVLCCVLGGCHSARHMAALTEGLDWVEGERLDMDMVIFLLASLSEACLLYFSH